MPWRDAGPERPEGRVVIVSGTPRSGRASVLGQVAGDLRRAGVRVVRRAMRDGVLRTVDDSGPGEHAVQGAKVRAAPRCRTTAHAQPPTNRERRWPAG